MTNDDAPVFSVLTYNVHSCIGTDRKLDIDRIADVITECSADIVLLQELDVGRRRTNSMDQAHEIAWRVRMKEHFHPALHVEEERYGDAILTAHPSRLIRSDALPSIGEPRGALWVEVMISGYPVNVINTHLGLRRGERMAQVLALKGGTWLGDDACQNKPTVFGGDLNAVPSSAVFKTLRQAMQTEGLHEGRRRLAPTFPSRLPLLRLDHIFYSDKIELLDMSIMRTPKARVASDHLPLMGRFKLKDYA